MNQGRIILRFSLSLAIAAPAFADYDSHPYLQPEVRCANLPDGAADFDCQPLVWDIPATAEVGARAPSKPIAGTGLVHGYESGLVDRPPTMYYDTQALADTGEYIGYERNFSYVYATDGSGHIVLDASFRPTILQKVTHPERHLTCSQPGAIPGDAPVGAVPEDYIPYWKKTGLTDAEGNEIFEVACRRGERAHYGPWSFGQLGVGNEFEITPVAVGRLDNSDRLDRDVFYGRTTEQNRLEWSVGMEIYNHIGSHHANMWSPVKPCNDSENPDYVSHSDECRGPGGYQETNWDNAGCRSDAFLYPGEGPKRGCGAYSRLQSPSQWQAATQFPGRFEVELPEGRAVPLVENQLAPAEHHVVSRGYYVREFRDFNRQRGGMIGEITTQVFTEPITDPNIKRADVLFEAVAEAAALVVPPFTVAPNSGVWYAPYDLELALLTTHSHKRTVRSFAQVLPVNPVRPNDPDPTCGGAGARHVYESYDWSDAKICKYYESPDGPITLRKGQGIEFTCIFNNGVRFTKDLPPEAADVIERSSVGRDFLYGDQPRDIYRVKFGCEENVGGSNPIGPESFYAPGGELLVDTPAYRPPGGPGLQKSKSCTPPADPNDDDPYVNHEECPPNQRFTGRCVPSAISFGDAEDEMCILVGLYWPLDVPVDYDVDIDGREGRRGFDERDPTAIERMVEVGEEPIPIDPDVLTDEDGNPRDPNEIGTPGRLPKSPSDIGKCNNCSQAMPPLI